MALGICEQAAHLGEMNLHPVAGGATNNGPKEIKLGRMSESIKGEKDLLASGSVASLCWEGTVEADETRQEGAGRSPLQWL